MLKLLQTMNKKNTAPQFDRINSLSVYRRGPISKTITKVHLMYIMFVSKWKLRRISHCDSFIF